MMIFLTDFLLKEKETYGLTCLEHGRMVKLIVF